MTKQELWTLADNLEKRCELLERQIAALEAKLDREQKAWKAEQTRRAFS